MFLNFGARKSEGKMDFKTVYVSSNCNQVPTAADRSRNNVIAYGSANAILIYDPNYGSGGKVVQTLIAHTKRVNSVRWIRGASNQDQELISGSADGAFILWTLKEDRYVPTRVEDEKFKKNVGVNIVDGYYYKDTETVLCSVCIDSESLRIWRRKDPHSDVMLEESLLFGTKAQPRLCVALRLSIAPNKTNQPILACGLDNCNIELLAHIEAENKWIKVLTLTGHENWVRGLDFTADENGGLVLASCAQDALVRIWRIQEIEPFINNHSPPKIIVESVLAGHEGWIYSVDWSPTKFCLLSASLDKSLVVWEFNSSSGLWLEKARLGEIGGNTLGFYGAFFDSSGQRVIGYSYHGAFHIWQQNEDNLWDPCVTVGGHFGEVVDLAWEPNGEFLYSVSTDQTTRIHAPWQKDSQMATWHEIARPQVHGYDLSAISVISRCRFASGAEEKVIRVFEAPENFADNFARLCPNSDVRNLAPVFTGTFVSKGASIPSLGLSNKAVYTSDNIEDTLPIDNKNPYPEESHFVEQVLDEPPTEETLLQNTLWPEIQKLYGHGYEIYSLASSPDGKWLASACKSAKAQHAAILIWDTSNWQQVQDLPSHNLTVVQMQFAPDSCSLLSVSRDRRWSMFVKSPQERLFHLDAATDKHTSIHTRIIWTCGWTHDSNYFATGSRDGRFVIWTKNLEKEPVKPLGQYEKAAEVFNFPNESVTALAFAPVLVDDSYLCAVGLERGTIDVLRFSNSKIEKLLHLPSSVAHHMTVKRLAFRPKPGRTGEKWQNERVLQFSSCSSDTSVRIYELIL